MSVRSRQLARQIFTEALAAVTVDSAIRRTLRRQANLLHAGPHTFDLAAFHDIQIIAIGKAGAALFDAVRPFLPSTLPVRSIISAPTPPSTLAAGDQFFPGGHPTPNEHSIAAATAARTLLRQATGVTLVLFLISGGASAMFELPIDPAIPLADLIELNRQLIASGASIHQVNTIRKHLSAVKGGRLAAAAPSATKLSLLVSDVPPNHLNALASGPTLPDPTTVHETLALIHQFLHNPPPSIHALLHRLPETPKPGDPAFARNHHLVLLDNAALLAAAQQAAERLGFHVTLDNDCDDWPYDRAATHLLDRARTLAAEHPRSCLLSGGEVTVQLPPNPGVGGRNQQLALFAARHLHPGLTLLSAGSDGIDGSSPAAGGVVDDTTLARARAAGLSPAQALARFDTFSLFNTLNDTILTGPSGNNLRDIRILLTGDS